MTRREKLLSALTDDQLLNAICTANRDCKTCPIFIIDICHKVDSKEEFKAWLDKEVENDGSV